jgi:cytochrome P450
MFLGLALALPSFLAKAWLALVRHPEQMTILIERPSLIPGAGEELLRYAGTVHSLFRYASTEVKLGDIGVKKGQFIYLKIDSANYDPEKYEDPYQLDLTRKVTGHLALGLGSHGCVGAVLVRTACMILLPIFAQSAAALDENRPTLWTRDRSLQWPVSVPATLKHSLLCGE